jgi:hypothetical protein
VVGVGKCDGIMESHEVACTGTGTHPLELTSWLPWQLTSYHLTSCRSCATAAGAYDSTRALHRGASLMRGFTIACCSADTIEAQTGPRRQRWSRTCVRFCCCGGCGCSIGCLSTLCRGGGASCGAEGCVGSGKLIR